jgi:hypothetical protein
MTLFRQHGYSVRETPDNMSPCESAAITDSDSEKKRITV